MNYVYKKTSYKGRNELGNWETYEKEPKTFSSIRIFHYLNILLNYLEIVKENQNLKMLLLE